MVRLLPETTGYESVSPNDVNVVEMTVSGERYGQLSDIGGQREES
jgi:hypothetical protein